MRLAAGLRPDPLGELERSPRPRSRNSGGGVPASKREGREWTGKRPKGKEGGGKGERRKGRGEEGGQGKEDLHPTLFLGPAIYKTFKRIFSKSINRLLHC